MKEMIIRFDDMPCYVHGYAIVDENDDYNVYINSRLSYETQRDTIQHEISHIQNDDFHNYISITTVEKTSEERLRVGKNNK